MLNSRRNRTFKVEQDWSLLNRNIYLYKRKIGRKRSTYGRKKALNDRLLKFDGVLSDVVYSSGLSNSSRSSKHLILDGKIEVNGLVVKVPSLKLKSGDVVTCTDSKSLLWYYIQRWNSIQMKIKVKPWKWNKMKSTRTAMGKSLAWKLRRRDFRLKKTINGNFKSARYSALFSVEHDSDKVLPRNRVLEANKKQRIPSIGLRKRSPYWVYFYRRKMRVPEIPRLPKYPGKRAGKNKQLAFMELREDRLRDGLNDFNVAIKKLNSKRKVISRFKKYKFMVPNSRIHRIGFNSVLFI